MGATLSSAGRRSLEIVRTRPGISSHDFAVEFWGRLGLTRIPQAEMILGALAEQGFVSGSIRFRGHGKLWTLTKTGKEALNG